MDPSLGFHYLLPMIILKRVLANYALNIRRFQSFRIPITIINQDEHNYGKANSIRRLESLGTNSDHFAAEGTMFQILFRLRINRIVGAEMPLRSLLWNSKYTLPRPINIYCGLVNCVYLSFVTNFTDSPRCVVFIIVLM